MKVALAWSGGKDSALAFEALRAEGCEIAALVTTIADPYDRVSHHGVRAALVRAQAEAVGARLVEVRLPGLATTNEIYEARLSEALTALAREGIGTVAFGDLFLEDIRRYRERHMASLGLAPCFPIWGRDTAALARDFASRYRATIACVDGERLPASFAGRDFGEALGQLPEGVDPCGENGEFHTFVWDGPIFARPVPVVRGEVVRRDTRWFADLLPAG